MELLDNIIHNSMNLGFGIGVAIIIAAVILILVFAIKGTISISPLCYLITLILATILSFQFSLMSGAMSAKEEISDISESINTYAQLIVNSSNEYLTMEDIGSFIEEAENLLTDLSTDMGQQTIGEVDKNDIGDSLMASAKSYLSKYILFRLLWSLFFIVVAIVLMIMLPNNGGISNYRKSYIRSEGVCSRRSLGGRRPNRRMKKY